MTLWERLYKEYQDTGELLVDLGSDQTSCHDPFGGGYYPVQLGFDEAKKVNKDAKENTTFKTQNIARFRFITLLRNDVSLQYT